MFLQTRGGRGVADKSPLHQNNARNVPDIEHMPHSVRMCPNIWLAIRQQCARQKPKENCQQAGYYVSGGVSERLPARTQFMLLGVFPAPFKNPEHVFKTFRLSVMVEISQRWRRCDDDTAVRYQVAEYLLSTPYHQPHQHYRIHYTRSNVIRIPKSAKFSTSSCRKEDSGYEVT